MNRGRFVSRNLPELGKSAEMIESDIVKILCHPAHAVYPPCVSLFFHHVPTVERIAPTLAILAEKIGRHSGDDLGIKFGVQAKQIGMRPDIGAVEIHEDRNVAHDTNRMFRTIGSKRLPLFEEKKLHRAADIEFFGHFQPYLIDGRRFPMTQSARPAVPAFEFETGAQAIEENKIVEPPSILHT